LSEGILGARGGENVEPVMWGFEEKLKDC